MRPRSSAGAGPGSAVGPGSGLAVGPAVGVPVGPSPEPAVGLATGSSVPLAAGSEAGSVVVVPGSGAVESVPGPAVDSAAVAVGDAAGLVPSAEGSPPEGVPQEARRSRAAAAAPSARVDRDVVGDMWTAP